MGHSTAHAIAIGKDHVAIAGTTSDTQAGVQFRTYAGHPTELVRSIPRLLAATAHEIGTGEGTLVVDRIPGTDPTILSYLEACRSAGWQATDAAIKHGSTWVTLTKGTTTIHTFVGQVEVDKAHECVLALPGDSATTIAKQMATYQHVLGTAWRVNGGATCHAFLRQHFARPLPKKRGAPTAERRPQPRWHWKPWTILPASSLLWKAPVPSIKKCMSEYPYAHHFDVRAQYLAGMSMASLGWNPPQEWGSCTFDPKVDGYWKIRILELPKDPWFPRAIPATRINSHRAVVTTPVMNYLITKKDFRYEIEDSSRYAESGRYLRSGAEAIRNARVIASQRSPRVLKALKETYTHGIGLMASPGGTIERQDWRDNIVDMCNMGVLRKIDKIPSTNRLLEVNHDSLWIMSHSESPDDLIKAICGPLIGNLRYEETLTTEAYLEKR